MEFNKKVYKNLDMCLHCNACKNFCPSDIDAEKIITSAKIECYKHASFFKKMALTILDSNSMLSLASKCVSAARFFRFFDLLSFLKPAKLIKFFINENVKYKPVKSVKNLGLKVFYFPGCINTYFNKSILNSLKIVAEKNGFKLIVPEGLKCCSIAHLSAGDYETFSRNAALNLDMIPDDVDYVVFDCASCHMAFEMYDDVFDSKKTKALQKKLIHLNNFLAEQEIHIPENVNFDKVVTEHVPCHLKDKESIREIVKKLPFIKKFEKDDSGECCGASGLFCFEHSKVSTGISRKKAAVLEEKADLILTSCSSCTMGLLQGLSFKRKEVKILNPVELLAQNYLSEEKKNSEK